jgi:hypothetical protein
MKITEERNPFLVPDAQRVLWGALPPGLPAAPLRGEAPRPAHTHPSPAYPCLRRGGTPLQSDDPPQEKSKIALFPRGSRRGAAGRREKARRCDEAN